MSNLAQEEADRLFSQHTHLQSHPEDLDNSDRDSVNEKDITEPVFTDDLNQDTDDEVDLSNRMAALTNTKSTFVVPAIAQHANTGPKGVIADAQSFTRAKRVAYKLPTTSITNIEVPYDKTLVQDPGSGSEEEEDADFMAQWRADRLAELAAEADSRRTLNASHTPQRRVSPSRRTYGRATRVDATGYLDAIEKVSSETTVVVMIYDPDSAQSDEVEDEVDILAYKHGHVRFVKLHHNIAEMEHIQIPAILVYRGGHVISTISGVSREGLEKVLQDQGTFT